MSKALSPAQVQALYWLPPDTRLARLASCDQTRTTPKALTLRSLAKQGLAETLNLPGMWWRITPAGLEARVKASGAYPEQRVTS